MTDTYTPVLTDEQIQTIGLEIPAIPTTGILIKFARAIERAAIEAYQRQHCKPFEFPPLPTPVAFRDGGRITEYRGTEHPSNWPFFLHKGTAMLEYAEKCVRLAQVQQQWRPLPPPPEQPA